MKKAVFAAVSLIILLTACAPATSPEDAAEAAARQQMSDDGLADAQITDIVEGDPAVVGADELYCVATDASNGDLPYLLVVWSTDSTWQARQLAEGYYEWDLQGCPR
jgi:hypothetical protein